MTAQRDGWRFYGWWRVVLPAFLIILTTNTLTLAGLNVFDAALLTALQVDRAELKVGDTLLLLAAAASAPVGGWVADRYGVRPALVAGLLLLAAGLYAHSGVQSLGEVYLLRLLLGASLGGAGLVICVTLVSRWFVARRGLALGLMLAGTSLGNALYPSLNAWLIARHGWREAFTIIALAPLLLLPLALFVIKDSPARAGLQPLGALPWPEGAGGCGTPAAAGDLAAALRTRDFWLIATAGFCTFFALLGFSNNLFLHMRDLGYDDAAAARAYFPLFAMGLVGKLGAGALSEWLPRKTVFLLFLGLMLGGSVLFATLDATLLWPALWIFGLGWGGNYTLLQALVADVFGVGSLGRILGSLTVIDALGGALGPFVLALLFRASDSYQGGFVLMSGLIALALAAAMAVRVPRPAVT